MGKFVRDSPSLSVKRLVIDQGEEDSFEKNGVKYLLHIFPCLEHLVFPSIKATQAEEFLFSKWNRAPLLKKLDFSFDGMTYLNDFDWEYLGEIESKKKSLENY